MTERNKTKDKRLSDLSEAVQLFKLDVETMIKEIEALDEETKKRLQDYQQKKRTAEVALGDAAQKKQAALQLARQLSNYNERLRKFRHQAVMLSRFIRYENLSQVHNTIEQIAGLLARWSDAGAEKDCNCGNGSDCDCRNQSENVR